MNEMKKCSQCGEDATTYVGVWYYCALCWMKKYAPENWTSNNRHVQTNGGHVRFVKSGRS